MNQKEMNQIAITYMDSKTVEVVKKLSILLNNDMNNSSNEASFECLRHIHNRALFHVLLGINCSFISEESNREKIDAYKKYSEQKYAQFMEFCENMRDFDLQNDGYLNGFDAE